MSPRIHALFSLACVAAAAIGLAGCPSSGSGGNQPGNNAGTHAASVPVPPDMALKELCPPKPVPDGMFKNSEEQLAATKKLDEEKAKVEEAKKKEQQSAQGKACEDTIADLLAGKAVSAAHLDALQKAVPTLNQKRDMGSFDLLSHQALACAAVALDSADPCNVLPEHKKQACTQDQSFFHFAREADKNPTWYFDARKDSDLKGLPAPLRSALHDALAARSPDKCPSGKFNAGCRALFGDKAACPQESKECPAAAEVQRIALITKGGLAAMAQGGAGADANLANAALGKKEGCAVVADKLREECMKFGRALKPSELPIQPAAK